MIKNRPLDHIGLAVEDVEKDVAWYKDILGFTVSGCFKGDDGNNVYFIENTDKSVKYEIYQAKMSPEVRGKIDHLSFVSDDVEADYKYCKDAGYTITTDGIEGIPSFWENGVRYFKIQSPTGEELEFCQKL